MSQNEIEYIASYLLDGGWESTDEREIQSEYGYDDDELKSIINQMKLYEGK